MTEIWLDENFDNFLLLKSGVEFDFIEKKISFRIFLLNLMNDK